MSGQSRHSYSFGCFRLEEGERRLLRDGQPVILTPKAFEILLTLVENNGHLVDKEELMKRVWPDSFVEESNLAVNISALRKALDESAGDRSYIETVPTRGYRFVASVTRVEEQSKNAMRPPVTASGTALMSPGAQEPPFAAKETRLAGGRSVYRGLTAALVVALLGIAGYFAWHRFSRPAGQPPRKIMLVVLPFDNMSGDPAQEYFSDGMTEELITELGRLQPQRLGVIARASAMQFRNTGKGVAQIAQELRVDYVMEGSVRRSGDRVRITAQLIQVTDQTHRWAGSYDRNVRDVINLQSEVARMILAEIKPALMLQGSARPARFHTLDPKAYEAYLKGRYFWNRRTPADINLSVEYYRQAIQADPGYAQAYAGLADSLLFFGGQGSKPAALKAMELDETLAEPHATLAFLKVLYEWDWAGAEREFHRALELDSNYATAHHWYGIYLDSVGRVDAAVAELRIAAALDPLSLIIKSMLAEELLMAGQTDEASEQLREVLEMDPNFWKGHWLRGSLYRQRQQYDQAIAEFQKAKETGGFPYKMDGEIGVTYALAGRRAEAESTLAKLKKLGAPHATLVALIYMGLGDKDQAFSWLEVSRQRREEDILKLKGDPRFNPLRADPRFQALVRRVGLPP